MDLKHDHINIIWSKQLSNIQYVYGQISEYSPGHTVRITSPTSKTISFYISVIVTSSLLHFIFKPETIVFFFSSEAIRKHTSGATK